MTARLSPPLPQVVRREAEPVARCAQTRRALLEPELPRSGRFLAGLLAVRALPMDTRELEAKIVLAYGRTA